MSDETIHLVIGVYDDEETGKAQYNRISEARKLGEIDFEAAAIVGRASDDKLHIHETDDMAAGRGAVVGGIIGGAIGLLAGPAGVVAGGAVGAWFGGLAAGSVDSGVPNTTLAEIGALIEPGSSAIVVMVNSAWRGEVYAWLQQSGAYMADTGSAAAAEAAADDGDTEDTADDGDTEETEPV